VAVYVTLRTAAAPDLLVQAWNVVAVISALVSPLAGLTMLAAIGPFTQALTDDGRITAAALVLAGTAAGVAVRVAIARSLPRFSWPIGLAVALLLGTGLGVAHSWLAFSPLQGRSAAELWLVGIGAALAILLAAAWLAWRGEARPFFVAVSSSVVAGLVSTIDFVGRGALYSGPLGWVLRSDDYARLSGIIPAPNASAAIFLVAFAVCLAVVVLDSWMQLRLLALAAAAIAAVALVLTYSRSGVLAAALAVVVIVWQRWRVRGLTVAIVVLAVAGIAGVVAGLVREVPTVADQDRVTAWAAAARMWQAEPVIGAGFRSFEWLHAGFGSPVLDAPHNEWLRLFAEEGSVVGLAGVAFALLTPRALLRSRGVVGATGVVTAAAGAAAAAVFLMAFFNNPFTYLQVNSPVFIVIGTGLGLAIGLREPLRASTDRRG
jgi:hypothetical protein